MRFSLAGRIHKMIPVLQTNTGEETNVYNFHLLAPGYVVVILKVWFSNSSHRIAAWTVSAKFFQVNATAPHQWEVNIGSGNGLVSSGNKPLHYRSMALIGHNELTCYLFLHAYLLKTHITPVCFFYNHTKANTSISHFPMQTHTFPLQKHPACKRLSCLI